MDNDRDDNPPQEWLDVLAESEAQLAAGQTVPAEEVRRGLRESIARLETKADALPR